MCIPKGLAPDDSSPGFSTPTPQQATPAISHGVQVHDFHIAPQPSFPDDNRKLSSAFKALGRSWEYGVARITPKKFRCSLAASCDPEKFPMIKTTTLDCEWVDLLNYSGVHPTAKLTEFGCSTKKEIRAAVRAQYVQKLKRNPTRLQCLSQDLDNLPLVAMLLRYPRQYLSSQLAAM